MGTPYLSWQASLFSQKQAGKETTYLGKCTFIDSIPKPQGGRTPVHCRDGKGGYEIVATKRDPQDLIEFDLGNLLQAAAFEIEKLSEIGCPFNLYIMYRCGGTEGVFNDYERGFSVETVVVTDETLNNVQQRDAQDEVDQTFSLSAQDRNSFREISAGQKTTTETEDLNTIHSFVITECGACGEFKEVCEDLVIGADSDGIAAANVLISTDSGNTWAATAADPFAIGEDIVSIRMFQVDSTTVRIIATRSTDAANPLEVAYSDDSGATWTTANLGTTNAEAVVRDQGIMVIDENNLWVATDDGRVYFSSNGGATWTEQSTALTASGAAALHAVHFASTELGVAVGATDVIIYTIDGGTNWTAATATGGGNTLQTVWVFDANRWIVGDSAGNVYMTFDGGATWTAITNWTGTGTGSVTNLKFTDELNGFMTHTDGGTVGRLLRTVDGGYSFQRITGTTIATAGLEAVHACSINEAFAVGDDDGATGIIVGAGE